MRRRREESDGVKGNHVAPIDLPCLSPWREKQRERESRKEEEARFVEEKNRSHFYMPLSADRDRAVGHPTTIS